VLVLVMAGGVNYNGIWAGLGQPVSVSQLWPRLRRGLPGKLMMGRARTSS
jgi:hypothetical protein